MPIANEPKAAAKQVVVSSWLKPFGTSMAPDSTCGLTNRM